MRSYGIKIIFVAMLASQCSWRASALGNNAELDSLIQLALGNNNALKAERLQVEKQRAGLGAAFEVEKTRVYYGYDPNNLAANDVALRNIGAEQNFDFPSVYLARRRLSRAGLRHQEAQYQLSENRVVLNVSKLYQQVVFCQQKEELYVHLDSLFSHITEVERDEADEDLDHLEQIMTEAECRRIRTTLNQVREERQIAYSQLLSVLQVDSINIRERKLTQLKDLDHARQKALFTTLNERNTQVLDRALRLERSHWLPGINLHVFSGTNAGLGYRMNGFEVGLNLPLFFTAGVAKSKMARLELESWRRAVVNEEVRMLNFARQKNDELELHQEGINYYERYGSDLSDNIVRTATRGLRSGRLDFFQYIQSVKNAIELEIDYLGNMLQYNLTLLDLHYFNYQE